MPRKNKISHASYFSERGIEFQPPIIFTVDQDGYISDPSVDESPIRRELYDKNDYEFTDLESFHKKRMQRHALEAVSFEASHRLEKETGLSAGHQDGTCIEDLEYAAETFGEERFMAALKDSLEDWLNCCPCREDEARFLCGAHPDTNAYLHFSREYRLCRQLKIEIIEGEHPGSSYFGARLAVDVEEANRRAVRYDLPYVFLEVPR